MSEKWYKFVLGRHSVSVTNGGHGFYRSPKIRYHSIRMTHSNDLIIFNLVRQVIEYDKNEINEIKKYGDILDWLNESKLNNRYKFISRTLVYVPFESDYATFYVELYVKFKSKEDATLFRLTWA